MYIYSWSDLNEEGHQFPQVGAEDVLHVLKQKELP